MGVFNAGIPCSDAMNGYVFSFIVRGAQTRELDSTAYKVADPSV